MDSGLDTLTSQQESQINGKCFYLSSLNLNFHVYSLILAVLLVLSYIK